MASTPFFFQQIKNNDFVRAYAANMFVSANTDIRQKKFASGIIRYYRTIEFIAQFRLAKYNIPTGKDLTRRTHLNRILTKDVRSGYRKLCNRKDPNKINGLMEGHILLYILGNSPYENIKELEELRKITSNSRNNLNIIHGVSTGENNYQSIQKITEEILHRVFDNFSSYITCFDRIKLQEFFG
ncbi:hypothetical protein QUF80_20685 [Desulfococcaceae bacterium HSG8]|nr:hypothetical protein [Desulfococcaceae bacterium HSG8]